jgi:hypothetical protein
MAGETFGRVPLRSELPIRLHPDFASEKSSRCESGCCFSCRYLLTALEVYKRQPQAKFRIHPDLIERDMGAWNNHKVIRPKIVKPVEMQHKEAVDDVGANDAPEEMADGSLGPVEVEEKVKVKERGRSHRQAALEKQGSQETEQKERKAAEQKQHQEIVSMMGRAGVKDPREESHVRGAARAGSSSKHESKVAQGSSSNGHHHEKEKQSAERSENKEKDDRKMTKPSRPRRPEVPGMEKREESVMPRGPLSCPRHLSDRSRFPR